LLPDEEGAELLGVVALGALAPADVPVAAGVAAFGVELEALLADGAPELVPDELPEDPGVLDPPDELLLELLAAASAASSALPRRDGSSSIRSRAVSIRDPSERSKVTLTVTFQSPAI